MKTNPMIFYGPDTDAGSSAAAILEPPAETEVMSLEDLELPDTRDVEDLLNEKIPELPLSTKKPEAKEVKKAETKTEPSKKAEETKKSPEDKKPETKGEPHNAELRKAKDSAVKERDDAKALVAELEKQVKENPELLSLRTELEAAKKEREALQKEAEGYSRKMAMLDPRATRPIRELDEKFDREMLPQLGVIPGLTGKEGIARYGALVNQFEGLPHGTPEFNDALREFRETLRSEFEDDASNVLGLLRRGSAHRQEAAGLMQKLNTDAQKMILEDSRASWTQQVKEFDAESEKWGIPDDALKEKFPHHPLVFLEATRKVRGEDFDREAKIIRDYVRQMNLDPKPESDEDFPGLSREEVARARAEFGVKRATDKKTAMRLQYETLLLARNFQPFFQDYLRIKERLEKIDAGDPPDPTDSTGGNGNGQSGEDDVTKYEAPPIRESDFE